MALPLAVKEHPILMSAPMVLATLEDRKGQTRRALRPQPKGENVNHFSPSTEEIAWRTYTQTGHWRFGHCRPMPDGTASSHFKVHGTVRCPYGSVGDILWVREAHWRYGKWVKDGLTKSGRQAWRFVATHGHNTDTHPEQYVRFEAPEHKPAKEELGWHKRVSLFIPRWASRIKLEVTGVWVEQLQDISEDDCSAEGCSDRDGTGPYLSAFGGRRIVNNYAHLWESINGEGSWSKNPWVWVISFRRIKQ